MAAEGIEHLLFVVGNELQTQRRAFSDRDAASDVGRVPPYDPSSPSASSDFSDMSVPGDGLSAKVKRSSRKGSVDSCSTDGGSVSGRDAVRSKLAHIASEKKRRASIRNGFDELRNEVPTCNACHSKAAILQKAVEHIRQLKQRKDNRSETEEALELKRKLSFAVNFIEALNKQKAALADNIARLEADLARARADQRI